LTAVDIVNFHALDPAPDRFRGRKLHHHTALVTLMRTTQEENARLANWPQDLRLARPGGALAAARRLGH
jgi:uncharacterized protein (UPF0261 family)